MKTIFAILIFCVYSITWSADLPPIPAELQGKNIKMIVPWAGGGPTDTTQRFMMRQFETLTGINVIIMNRPGAQGSIGIREAANSLPDGLTLLGDSNSAVLNTAAELPNSVDFKSLIPVVIYTQTPQFFYTGANSKFQTMQDLIKYGKNNQITLGCSNLYSCMFSRAFFDKLGINVLTVMFKTPVETAISAYQNSVDVFANSVDGILPLVQDQKITPLATTWRETFSIYPNAPPANNFVPGFSAANFQIVWLPRGTPPHIVDYYRQVLTKIKLSNESRERASTTAAIVFVGDERRTQQFLDQEYELFRQRKRFAQID